MRQRGCFERSESDYPVTMLSYRRRTILQLQIWRKLQNYWFFARNVSQSLQIAENYKEGITMNFKNKSLLFMANNQK